MPIISINADTAPEPVGGYAQAVECVGATRRLYVSGQTPMAGDGTVPETFPEQARFAWANVEAQLAAAGMTLRDLVKVTIFLGSRHHADENARIRQEVLQGHAPALTVIIAGIFDDSWLLEIEAIAET